MKKGIDYWESMFDYYARVYPQYAERTINWFPSGEMEITVRLDDRTFWVFDMMGPTIKPLGNKELNPEAEDEISEEEYRIRLSRNLRIKMYHTTISQDTLSKRSGISAVTINKYMNAKATPSAYNLERIARALQCSATELLVY
ncbi:XRE family transcriptional regulator [Firmicutes bacterium AM31-12AC]|nr:XRE family transcriptional regulator [Firmicutes bacterium AM31-12AC]